jgi:amidophosphoribosyltransferase
MMDRLNQRSYEVIRQHLKFVTDCYGIDMAKLEGLVAFRALELLKRETYTISLMKYIQNVKHRTILTAMCKNYVTLFTDPLVHKRFQIK